MHNNLKIELIQEQAHSLRGNCFGNKKNIPWPKLGESDKKCVCKKYLFYEALAFCF